MDLIIALRRVIDPLVASTSIVLAGIEPLTSEEPGGYGFLEYDAVLTPGSVMLLGFYQRSAFRTVTAVLWSPERVSSDTVQPGNASMAVRHQVWSYDALSEVDLLAWSIVTEVISWLPALDATIDPNAGTPTGDA